MKGMRPRKFLRRERGFTSPQAQETDDFGRWDGARASRAATALHATGAFTYKLPTDLSLSFLLSPGLPDRRAEVLSALDQGTARQAVLVVARRHA